jgi:hypothetical protein
VRIVLRRPSGQAPGDVIAAYDINDYKEKTELTAQKLATTLYAALRRTATCARSSTAARLERVIRRRREFLAPNSRDFPSAVLAPSWPTWSDTARRAALLGAEAQWCVAPYPSPRPANIFRSSATPPRRPAPGAREFTAPRSCASAITSPTTTTCTFRRQPQRRACCSSAMRGT